MPSRLFLLRACALLGLAATLAGTAAAQASKPVLKIVVGSPAGGSVDTLARLVADKIKGPLDRAVIVENRAGAAGGIAAEAVKRAAPDGNTVWITPSAAVVAQPLAFANLKYDPFKDFTPVSQLATFQMVLAVPSGTATSVEQYLARAKADQAMAMYASPAAGSLLHFYGVMLSQETGVALMHVPYQGTAAVLPALVGNQVPAAFLVVSDAIQYHRNQRMKALAVAGEQRSPYLPDVPTFKELGYKGLSGIAWYAAYAPARTPKAVVDEISKAMAQAVREADVVDKLKALGLDATGTSAEQLGAVHHADWDRLGPVIKASGFKGE
ncbi:MAG TPA: tripartite tricarboxylate transporter substrate-binding protein [Pseudorhodoferax sp.]|jgi:tripartite-type tricarboxylate transporter receptor subunit TctC|nr:tripartite tricarboxylate transporter substrate-binding protein [Pseudorhodoferax sp.]